MEIDFLIEYFKKYVSGIADYISVHKTTRHQYQRLLGEIRWAKLQIQALYAQKHPKTV